MKIDVHTSDLSSINSRACALLMICMEIKMISQKLENLLNLALSIEESERQKSAQLNVGYSEATDTWELIVKYNGDIGRLSGSVIQVEELIAGYAIVTIPENLIDTFAQLDEVEYVEKPKRLYFSTLQGRQASCVFPVTVREPFLTGRGVLVGIIDSGIDYQSAEFKNDNGETRIQYLWDQTLMPETVNAALPEKAGENLLPAASPEGFGTGVEFTKFRIDEALKSRDPQQIVPSIDSTGHGTAVAAIAAARGNLREGQYEGMAPESELIIVKLGVPARESFPRTTELMRALTYAVRKAVSLGKPISINLSFGNTYGSHDGTSLVERFIDNISEIGRTVICVGSGNEGAAGGHVAGTVARGTVQENQGSRNSPEQTSGSRQAVTRIELNVAAYQPAINVQLWKEYTDHFIISLIAPSGQTEIIDTLTIGKKRFVLDNTELLCYVGEPSPYSVNQEVYFDFLPEGSYVSPGVWTFELLSDDAVIGNYDLYLPSHVILNAGTRFFTPTPVKTLTIPSTAGKVITVGAYDAVYDSYADFSGRGYALQSSVADRMNPGSMKPDLAAPGVGIQTIIPGNQITTVSGTSFAVPFVTGAAALLMEWGIVRGNDPYLYGEKVKAYLRKGARKMRGEEVYPNDRVGAYGNIVSS